MTSYPCPGCSSCLDRGKTTCLWCGAKLFQGRIPSERERYETSPEARQARLQAIEEARRDPDDIDLRVCAAISEHLKPLDEFTHDYLVQFTGLNACAVKHALIRLSKRGLVQITGQVRIRSNRFREKWQVLLPVLQVTSIPIPGPGTVRIQRQANRGTPLVPATTQVGNDDALHAEPAEQEADDSGW